MPGLTFQGQNNRGGFPSGAVRRPGGWIVALALVVISIALITLCVRFDGGGPFATVRTAVQSVTKPVEQFSSGLAAPLRAATSGPTSETEQLKRENEQLRAIVGELEEYRQQNQRLSALVQLSDIYGLSTVSANVTGITTGWSRVATLDVGSAEGIRVGMGVISSCGLFGQVESVTQHACTVRMITDSNSSVSAMIQGTRARGILDGSYDGVMTLEYISTEYSVGEGDYVITSGDGGVYPNGIIIGTVKDVNPDPSKLYYRITVDPIFSLASCQEAMVLTGDEDAVANILDEDLLANVKNSMIASDSKAATDAIDTARAGAAQASESGDGAASSADADASAGSASGADTVEGAQQSAASGAQGSSGDQAQDGAGDADSADSADGGQQ